GQHVGHLWSPHAHDLRFPLRVRVVDPVVEASPLQGVVKLARPVGGDDHDRRLLGPDGAVSGMVTWKSDSTSRRKASNSSSARSISSTSSTARLPARVALSNGRSTRNSGP